MRSHCYLQQCCKGGKVRIPPYKPRPEPLHSLATFAGDTSSKSFIRNIWQCNCLFVFTSMGAHIDTSVNDGPGLPLFKICGQVHHHIGSLLPEVGLTPQFLQLYIYDTGNEIQNRLGCLNPGKELVESLDPIVVEQLMTMLDQHNPFVRKFRTAQDQRADYEQEEFIIRIVGAREGDAIQYNLPKTDELAMLVVGDFSLATFKRDIIIE
jgi:hypothetical protein